MVTNRTIQVQGTQINVLLNKDRNDYICLTDMTKNFEDGPRLIEKWLTNKSTIDFLGVWEQLNNPDFKTPEFGGIRMEAGSNRFYMSVNKFIERTGAIGLFAKAGRYGGTYAHKDIAYHFGMWLSPEFNLLVVKEFQRLVEAENNPLILQWDITRILSKTNYQIHTDAIKDNILPQLSIDKKKEYLIYASEADMLNLALFGCRAKDWEMRNPKLAEKGFNLRDTATINQLIVLSNMEVMNAEMIKRGVERIERFNILQQMAIEELESLNKTSVEQQFKRIASKYPLSLKQQHKDAK
ncbi:MAG: KilA-N domain-containing protein [Paludibacteraceae bacterium]|nr:KilA-N domain-containing protein [Paludibacteraceae bacterium]